MHIRKERIAYADKCTVSSAGHPWVRVDGVAPDKPLDSAILSRLTQFSAMNKLKKMVLRVSFCNAVFNHWNITKT